jgi:hypothetical protein
MQVTDRLPVPPSHYRDRNTEGTAGRPRRVSLCRTRYSAALEEYQIDKQKAAPAVWLCSRLHAHVCAKHGKCLGNVVRNILEIDLIQRAFVKLTRNGWLAPFFTAKANATEPPVERRGDQGNTRDEP